MAEYTVKLQDDRFETSGLGRLVEHDERSRRYAFNAADVTLASVHHESRVRCWTRATSGAARETR